MAGWGEGTAGTTGSWKGLMCLRSSVQAREAGAQGRRGSRGRERAAGVSKTTAHTGKSEFQMNSGTVYWYLSRS